jgi:hypothetical protein
MVFEDDQIETSRIQAELRRPSKIKNAAAERSRRKKSLPANSGKRKSLTTHALSLRHSAWAGLSTIRRRGSLLGSTSTIGDLNVADRFNSSFLLFYWNSFQGVANHICDPIRSILRFGIFSLGLHVYTVPHFAYQLLFNKDGLLWKQATSFAFLLLPLSRVSHSINLRIVYIDF